MIPYCCPVCNGRGAVPHGFYDGGSQWATTTVAWPPKEVCRSCSGTGIVWNNCNPCPVYNPTITFDLHMDEPEDDWSWWDFEDWEDLDYDI